MKQGKILNHWTHKALGLPYLHQRADRDDHVLIRHVNIPKTMKKHFELIQDEDGYVEYDHSSLLHSPYYVS